MPVMRNATLLSKLDWLGLSTELGLSDGKLLERFIAQRDEAAFAALVQRHGRMVQGVCRRVLGNRHDVEDAFQATFVVLVRRATSIVPRELVGNWLYGVAYNVAIKLRAISTRRQALERQRRDMTAEQPAAHASDLQAALDDELTRLPEQYRMPIVLCDLEGRSRKEVARQLGWKEGTLSGRLSRGRALLAQRLKRHGVALSVAGLAVALAAEARAAAPLAQLARATTKAALGSLGDGGLTSGLLSSQVLSIADEVVKGFLLSKLKSLTVASLIAVVALSGGLIGVHLLRDRSEPQRSQSAESVQRPETAPEVAIERIKVTTQQDPVVVLPWIDVDDPNGLFARAEPPFVFQVTAQFSWAGPADFLLEEEPRSAWVIAVIRGNGPPPAPAPKP